MDKYGGKGGSPEHQARQDGGLEEEAEEDRSPNALCLQRYYRIWRPVLPASGTTAHYYRPIQTTPTEVPGLQAVLPDLDPVLPVSGTTGPESGTIGPVCLRAPVGPSAHVPL